MKALNIKGYQEAEKKHLSLKRIISELFVLILVAFHALPIIWCFFLSLKTEYDIFMNPLALPNPPQWKNYILALQSLDLWTMFRNTMIIAVVSISISIVLAIFSSYAIARMKFGTGRLQKAFYIYFLAGIITPVFVLILPIYLIIVNMGIIDTLWSMIIPYLGFTAPTNTLILVAGFKSVPSELEEAAVIDGCGILRVLFSIVVPVVKPSIATAIVLIFLGIWNDFPLASVLLSSPQVQTIVLAASKFKTRYLTNYELTTAALMILVVPQLIAFAFLQKYIISGLTAGAIKG